jgi:hypothetical protein
MSTATPTLGQPLLDRLNARAAKEGWSRARLETALACAQALRTDAGKRCGESHIPKNRVCRKGVGALTPTTVTQASSQIDWRKAAAQAAGATAFTAAVALPVASFVRSGTPGGRRQTAAWVRQAAAVESIAMRGMLYPPAWPIAAPIAGGAMAAKEGIKAASGLRRRAEVIRQAPGWAKGAAGLARRKANRAADIRGQQAALSRAYEANTKPLTAGEVARRTREVERNTARAAEASRQAAIRARGARRAARIARTSNPWRNSPGVTERWLTTTLLGQEGNLLKRSAGAATITALRTWQGTGSRGVKVFR